MLKKFWNDEAGAIISAELAIVLTIVVIGTVTGLSSLRDAVITELADVGQAIAQLDQSYTVTGVLAHSSSTAPSAFIDAEDFCDTPASPSSAAGTRCVTIGIASQLTQGDNGSL